MFPAGPREPVSVDPPVAEVADEEVAAEAPEAARREGDAPRRVQRPLVGDAGQQPAAEIELIDIPAGRSVVAVDGRAPDEGYEQMPGDRPDAEGCVPLRDPAVDERAASSNPPPAAVVDVDPRVV